MYVLLAVMGICVMALVAAGAWQEMRPGPVAVPAWLRQGFFLNQLLLVGSLVGLLFLGIGDVLAQEPAAAGEAKDISIGFGLALIGVGLPTGLAAIGAAIALGPVGASALAVIAEKPEIFGRTLVYLGLSEGIAIYGLVMSILMLGRL